MDTWQWTIGQLQKWNTMSFEKALLNTMLDEVGPWFTLDTETKAGLCSTKQQKRKTGWVDDDADTGKETKFGISLAANPTVNIKTLTWDQASAIYKQKYWDPLKLDSVPEKIGILIFDCAVNHGVAQAAKFLQGAVGATEDGQVGPKTLQMVGSVPEQEIISRVLDRRRMFFKYIVLNKPFQVRFLKGWLSRCDRLEKLLR